MICSEATSNQRAVGWAGIRPEGMQQRLREHLPLALLPSQEKLSEGQRNSRGS